MQEVLESRLSLSFIISVVSHFFVSVFTQYPLRWFSTPPKLTEGSGFLAALYFQSCFSFIIPNAARTLSKTQICPLFKIWPWSFIPGQEQTP